jgi:dTDP-4-amino-4,6-dideoxygalactose transaminase
VDRAHHLREKGTNRAQFIQGLVDKYTWVDIGSSYVMSDMNAAHLWVQLQHLDQVHVRRQSLWEQYAQELETPPGVRQLKIPSDVTPNYHLFALIFENPQYRAAFIQYMRQCGITAPFHYVALHSSPYGQKLVQSVPPGKQIELPQTQLLAQGLVRLPLFYNMTDEELDWVIASTQRFFKNLNAAEARTGH